jgi:hypothetical protein
VKRLKRSECGMMTRNEFAEVGCEKGRMDRWGIDRI